jgi:hypothetical protein
MEMLMGHQASFLLTKADTVALEAHLRARFNLVAFRYRSKTSKPDIVDSLYIEENGKHVVDYYIARPEDMDAVVMDFIPEQNYWTVEVSPSPVIEMSGSSLNNNVFRYGRVYYVDHFLGAEGTWVKKDESFRKWGKALLTAVKKSLKKVSSFPGSIDYAGEEAAALLESGTVKISQL